MTCEMCGANCGEIVEIRLPKKFYEDHTYTRELPGGEVVRELAKVVYVRLTPCEIDEILDDANYWADPRILHSDERAMCSAAARTVAAIKKYKATKKN